MLTSSHTQQTWDITPWSPPVCSASSEARPCSEPCTWAVSPTGAGAGYGWASPTISGHMGFVVVLLSMGVSFLGIPPLGLAPLLIGVLLVGFSWNAVVSITAAYASDRFGISKLGVIYGTMFAVMPLGSGLGAYLGGLLYDFRGTYDWAIWSNILLLLVSALLVFSIREPRRPARLAVSAAD